MFSQRHQLAYSPFILWLLWLFTFTAGLAASKADTPDDQVKKHLMLTMKENLDGGHASIGNIVIEYDDYSYSDECKGVLVSPKYVFVPEHCRSDKTTPKRIRIGLAGQIVDLKTSPIESSDIYSIYEIDPSVHSLSANPARLGVENPKPDSELVSRKGDFTSRCYFDGWWPNAAEFDLKCQTTSPTIRVGEIFGWFFFDRNNNLTAFRANPHHINAVVPFTYILARSQILKSIVANDPPLQPAQSVAAALPNSLNERMKLWRKQVKYCDSNGNVVIQAPGAFPTKESDDETSAQ